MPADHQWYLVCYDVRDEKRLRKAAKRLEGYGQRVQYSIFRCHLSRAQAQQLRWELTEDLAPEDDLLMIPLCARCVGGIETTHTSRNRPRWPKAPSRHRLA